MSAPTDRNMLDDPDHLPEDYNWHPSVHTHRFEERLYFFLIRLREPAHRPVADQVREVLELADLRYACEYAVFGHWDALIRVWLTRASYRRLVRVFERSDVNITEFRFFEANQIRYLWTDSDTDLLEDDKEVLAAMAEHEDDIVAAVAQPETSSIWATLRGAGLAFSRPSASDGSVKFYMALKRVGGDMPLDTEEQAVLRAIRDSNMADRASLYIGVGTIAEYLVRCVARTYSEVLDLSASLDISLHSTRLRPMTLLVANTDAPESDNVNDKQALSEADQTSLALLDRDNDDSSALNAILVRLTQAERTALNELVRRAYELSQGDLVLRRKLNDMICACITNDHSALSSALAFLLDFEWFLGEYLKPAWAAIFGEDWVSRLLDDFRQCGLTREIEELGKPQKDWTLGSYVHMAIATSDFSELFESRLVRQLGPEWKTQMRLLLPLRNSFAHGRLRKIQRLDVLTGESFKFLNELMDVATLSARCENVVSNKRRLTYSDA